MSREKRDAGFGLVSAVFLLVVLAAAGAAMINIAGVQRSTASTAVEGARAYHAARSGIEWGVKQAIDAGACPPTTTLNMTEGGLRGFRTSVSCTSSSHTQNATGSTTYQLVSISESGNFGEPDYVRRRLRASITDAP